jgi:hypothetical protein
MMMIAVMAVVVAATTCDVCPRRFGNLDVVDGETRWSWWIPIYRFVVLKSHAISVSPLHLESEATARLALAMNGGRDYYAAVRSRVDLGQFRSGAIRRGASGG